MLHHAKKGVAVGQDKLIGSRAMPVATTGTIILEVDDEFSKIGTLNFILRHKKEKIKVAKDQNDIGWYAGLRGSEVLGLKKEDFDFENNLIHIRRRLEYHGVKKTNYI